MVSKAAIIRNQQNNNKKTTKAIVIIGIVIAFFVLFLSIGYAAFESSLFVDSFVASVHVDKDVRITNISSFSSENGGIMNSEDYNVDYLLTSFTLPNATSTVTYEVTVKNFGNTETVIGNIELPEALQNKLDLEIIDYTVGNIITDNAETCVDSVDGCKLDIIRTFYIKVKYKSGAYDASSTSFDNTVIQFNFDEVVNYNVTYYGMNNPGSWPTIIKRNDNLVVNFGSMNVLVLSVKVGDTVLYSDSLNFTNKILTIAQVLGDVEVNVIEASNIDYVIDPSHPSINMVISNASRLDQFYNQGAFHAANAMSETIKDITVSLTFTSQTNSNQVINGSLYIDGSLNQTKQITFSQSVSSPLAVKFENVNVTKNSVIELQYSANNVNNGKITITKQDVSFTYAS